MTRTLSLMDRLRRTWYFVRLSWVMRDVPSKQWTATSQALRGELAAAAEDVGMRQALADLGRPAVLGAHLLGTEPPRSRAHWSAGAVAVGGAIAAWLAIVISYGVGMLGAMADVGHVGDSSWHRLLGVSLRATNDADGGAVAVQTTPGIWFVLLVFAVVFIVASRAWRAFGHGARFGQPSA